MDIETLEKMIAAGNDSALLRITLASAHHDQGDIDAAITHARKAVSLDPGYSAAYKKLAELETESGQAEDAIVTYTAGIECAESQGDEQLVKVMQVFKRRLEKSVGKL